MIAPPELARALHGHDVLWLLDDADDVVGAPRVEADAAALALGDVAADLAEPHLLLDREERLGEAVDVRGVGTEQVEGDALGALWPDPGQTPELVNEVLNRAVVHAPSVGGGADAQSRRAWASPARMR